jgi:Lrp/AsnC family leucine-responsive transcriptional regulator
LQKLRWAFGPRRRLNKHKGGAEQEDFDDHAARLALGLLRLQPNLYSPRAYFVIVRYFMTKNAIPPLDAFDRAILSVVQRNNQLTHEAIGTTVGLSGSAVRRRLTELRKTGVIEADISVVSGEVNGLTFLVQVSFAREEPAIYEAFRRQMLADAAVSQCYSVAGDVDFILVAHASSPAAYEAWGAQALMANPAIARYSTTLVWSRVKFVFDVEPA